LPEIDVAVRAWNLMGGFDASWLEVVAEMLGVTDIERLVRHLALIREHQQSRE
jgi:hypothetical protein